MKYESFRLATGCNVRRGTAQCSAQKGIGQKTVSDGVGVHHPPATGREQLDAESADSNAPTAAPPTCRPASTQDKKVNAITKYAADEPLVHQMASGEWSFDRLKACSFLLRLKSVRLIEAKWINHGHRPGKDQVCHGSDVPRNQINDPGSLKQCGLKPGENPIKVDHPDR